MTSSPSSVYDGIPYPVAKKFSTTSNFGCGYVPRIFSWRQTDCSASASQSGASAASPSRKYVEISIPSTCFVDTLYGPADSKRSSVGSTARTTDFAYATPGSPLAPPEGPTIRSDRG